MRLRDKNAGRKKREGAKKCQRRTQACHGRSVAGLLRIRGSDQSRRTRRIEIRSGPMGTIHASSTRAISRWQLRTRALELGYRTLIMGVVNVTPDSFSDGGRFLDSQAAVKHGVHLLDEGADLLDLGAESTRPGSHAGGAEPTVGSDEEQARLLPVIEGIREARPQAVLSVDTYKATTAQAALSKGVEIINDVSGFTWDAELSGVCAGARCGVVLMHSRGRPDEWKSQHLLDPDMLLERVRSGLASSLQAAAQAGIATDSVVLDPGYGFGKQQDENFSLLARQSELLTLGRPLLAGLSRKSFLGHALAPLYGGLSAPVNARETASIAALVAAIFHGASIVRVHDVRPAREAARIADRILGMR
jgi:dihydropteroate synthase